MRKLKTYNIEEVEDYLQKCSNLFLDKISMENFRKMIKVSNEISSLNKRSLHRVHYEKKSRWNESLKSIQNCIPEFLVETLSKRT